MDTITKLESEIAELRRNLNAKENELYELKKTIASQTTQNQSNNSLGNVNVHIGDSLQRWAIERYSRQILIPSIGVAGQVKLCRTKVLVVGVGGLGCPAAAYLAGAGVGEIGLVDYDDVDVTNIHRQLLHTEADQKQSKVQSAADSLRNLNSNIKVTTYNTQLDSHNALNIIPKYDIVLDCTDNVPTRYLLSDACVLAKKPLISGSALKLEGQLTIYNHSTIQNDTTVNGPCYRCLFDIPPSPETVGSCSANGVCGPVTGVIGALQALEAIKCVVGMSPSNLLVERMLIFDGEDMTFRVVKLRPKNPCCAICSDSPKITQLIDYEAFCKTTAKEKDIELEILDPAHRVTADKLAELRNEKRHLLVDVRSEQEFNMCRIEGTVNFPFDRLERKDVFGRLLEVVEQSALPVTFICRRGNDSQVIAQRVMEVARENTEIYDLIGGLHAWSKCVDPAFPIY